MESEYGYEYDVSYEPRMGQDVILIDAGDTTISLSESDLRSMLEMLT